MLIWQEEIREKWNSDTAGDAADRIIVATARTLGATLITKDDKLRRYPHVETLW